MNELIKSDWQPEVSLPRLLKQLQLLLGLIKRIDCPHPQQREEELSTVIRELYISYELNNKKVIAICGLQGVGKTLFLRNYYGLDEALLRDNEGRGERTPVLIIEKDDISEPKAVRRRMAINFVAKDWEYEEEVIDATVFQKMIREPLSHNETHIQLLPVLYVPVKEKSRFSGFLLLPGYEKGKEKWITFMRHAMISSSTTLIVTDTNSMARSQNENIVEDMTKHTDSNTPIILISHVDEGCNPAENIIEKAKSTFKLKDDNQVVFIGTGSEAYVQNWRKKVESLIDNADSGDDFRLKQMRQLHTILVEELYGIILQIQDDVSISDELDPIPKQIENYLNIIKESIEKLRTNYTKNLKILGKIFEEVENKAKHSYGEEYHGFWGAVKKHVIDPLFLEGDTLTKNIQKMITDAYEETMKSGKEATENKEAMESGKKLILKSMTTTTFETLKIQNNDDKFLLESPFHQHMQLQENVALTPLIFSNIQKLFLDGIDSNRTGDEDKCFDATLKLLPALALEYSRFPFYVNSEYSEKDIKTPSKSYQKFVSETKESLNSTSQLLRAITVMFVADQAIDISIEGAGSAEIGAMFTNPYVIAGIAIIGLGVAIKTINDEHDLIEAKIGTLVNKLKQRQQDCLLENFDEVMNLLLEKVEERFAKRYNLGYKKGSYESTSKLLSDIKRTTEDILSNAPISLA